MYLAPLKCKITALLKPDLGVFAYICRGGDVGLDADICSLGFVDCSLACSTFMVNLIRYFKILSESLTSMLSLLLNTNNGM